MRFARESNRIHPSFAILIIGLLLTACTPKNTYIKMNPPPDVDKEEPRIPGDETCWLATASNMLAAAGYGVGNTVQDRADDIYADMLTNWEITDGGWVETALEWWLSSSHNIWPDNPYTVVEVWGNIYGQPIGYDDAPEWLGNYLRQCYFAGISISWPTDDTTDAGDPIIGRGGHAMTAWGDDWGDLELSHNPSVIKVTDSDRDTDDNYQVYTYDGYSNPNPGGANEGEGWYIDRNDNHPYIYLITWLESSDIPYDDARTQMVTGSYSITQENEIPASDLHYEVATDVAILSYRTWISWLDDRSPTITEMGSLPSGIEVDWDFTDQPIPQDEEVIITTEFVLPNWNGMFYADVHFTYPDRSSGGNSPGFYWTMITPVIDNASRIPNVAGGYVIGSFDLLDPRRDNRTVAEYRFSHQYWYDQDPEYHRFFLGGDEGYIVSNIKFGHSYTHLTTDMLWAFEDWLTVSSKEIPLSGEEISFTLDWEGQLPYPEARVLSDAVLTKREGLQDK